MATQYAQQGALVTSAGSLGLDFSANLPALPNIGASFGPNGPYANYVLVATVPAMLTRDNLEIWNSSGSQIAIVRDDGTATSGSAPSNVSVIPLSGGPAVGAQGGYWGTQTFKGRVQIYAPVATAFVTVTVD